MTRLAIACLLAVLAMTPRPALAQTAEARAEFAQRYAKLDINDQAAALALAKWAIEQTLLDEADEIYRLILRIDLDQEEAYGAIWHLSGDRALVTSSPAYELVRKGLDPETFREHETQRFVIISDADARWVREQGRRLEQSYDRFIRFANRLGLRPLPVRHKLVAVAFGGIDEFVAYSAEDGNTLGEQIAGYYSPRHDRLVFYHVESNRNVARGRDRLDSMSRNLDDLRRAARRSRTTGRFAEAAEARDKLREEEARHQDELARIETMAKRWSTSVIVHEAIHQLMFHTLVQSPYAEQPIWLSEGLATAFETDNTSRPFGPTDEYMPRRDAFWRLLDEDRLLPLRVLISIRSRSIGAAPGQARIAYEQSYALVSWMCRHRKLELRDYMRRINSLPPPKVSEEKLVEVFEAAFGEIERVERAWRRYEDE